MGFIPLFVGLGVDFGIQFAVKYRADTLILATRDDALVAAGSEVGVPLALAAAAVAAGFFAFLPTPYVGVSELGKIAGAGMVVAFILAVTVLPAVLHLVRPSLHGARAGFAALGPLDDVMRSHRKQVLWVNAAVAADLRVLLLPFVRFDSNPLDLKDPHSESMSTLNDLMKDPTQSPNTIDVLTPSTAAADALAAKLEKLPEVQYALTFSTFTPPDQPAKLAAIADARTLLDTTVNPFIVAPPPADAELAASLGQTATALRAAVGADRSPAGQDALALASALQSLAAEARPQHRAIADQAVSQPLNVLLGQLRAACCRPSSSRRRPCRRPWPASGSPRTGARALSRCSPSGAACWTTSGHLSAVRQGGQRRGAQRQRRAGVHRGRGQHHRRRLPRGRRAVADRHHDPAVRRAAATAGRAGEVRCCPCC